MSADRTKALEAAQKHLAKGNYDKAITELMKLVQADPSDVRTWLKIGDLQTRKGAHGDAIGTYARVAKQYGDQGFFLKAVAVYKQILKLDPERLDMRLQLAGMYEMLQLTSEALSAYEQIAAAYARAGDIERALEALRKTTEIEPENIPYRIKLGEALSRAGKTKEAADELEIGANLLEAQGRIDDYLKVAERVLFFRPDDVDLARSLAARMLERDQPKGALTRLQVCFKADPKDVKTLELLALAFQKLSQLPKTISVYREVARIHHEAQRHDERARILKKILELDPADAEARQALAGYAEAKGSVRRDIAPPPSAVVEPSRPDARAPSSEQLIVEEVDPSEIDLLDDDEEVLIVEDDEIVGGDEVVEAVDPPAAPARPSVPPDVAREAQIARLLTECDVFLRYGLKQKVIEQLCAVLEIDPLHVEARERLRDVYLDIGDVASAIGELLALAEQLLEDESAAAVIYLRQVLELEPAQPQARAMLDSLGVSGGSGETADTTEPLPEPALEPVPAAPDEDEVLFIEEEPPIDVVVAEPAVVELEPDPLDELPPAEPTALHPMPPESFDTPEDGVVPRDAMVPPPGPEAAVFRVPKPGSGDPLAPMSPAEFEDVPLRPSTPGQVAADAAQRRSIPPGEVEETLDEVDFYIAQGLYEEARNTLRDVLSSYPDHPVVLDKLREVDELAAAAAASRSRPEVAVDQSFELAERLAAELDDEEVGPSPAGSDSLDVDAVFAQFKKGVQEQVGVEDSDTHFDLGIAYKEMGLLDDAIAEFRLCLTAPARVCIAHTMIGLCHIEKGAVAEAIGHFKKGLYADTKTEREELGLYFELGNAYELMHDPKEALYYYQKVQKRDPTFREIAARIERLVHPQIATPEAEPMAPDDIDRAFDDLMGED